MLALALLLATSTPDDQEDVIKRWMDCVQSAANSWGIGTASTDQAAKAAIFECRRFADAYESVVYSALKAEGEYKSTVAARSQALEMEAYIADFARKLIAKNRAAVGRTD